MRPGREASALAPLPLSLLAVLPSDRLTNDDVAFLRRRPDPSSPSSSASTSFIGAERHERGNGQRHRHQPAAACRHVELRRVGKTRGKRGRGSARNYRLAPSPEQSAERTDEAVLDVLRRWGLKTLGEFAALPADALFERLGREGLELQEVARGRDARPLVPTIAGEPFEASLALEWPIEELEPLSFVLTRLFEPLCARLERCDRGAAVLHVSLQLVSRECHTRRLELPAPMRDPKVLRTLVLLDLESHPPNAGIDRVTLTIDPTPGRIVQHSLLARPLPSPEQLSTLTARLTAVMGDNRVGAPVLVDTHRPEAFAMRRFHVNDVHPRRPTARPRARRRDARRAEAHLCAGRKPRRSHDARRRRRRCARLRPPPLPSSDPRPRPRRARSPRARRTPRPSRRPRHPGRRPVAYVRRMVEEPSPPPPLERPRRVPRFPPTPARPRRTPKSWNRDEWDVALADGCHLSHSPRSRTEPAGSSTARWTDAKPCLSRKFAEIRLVSSAWNHDVTWHHIVS